MSLGANTYWEVQSGGADGNSGNGGGFDILQPITNGDTTLAATSATTSSPVVTSVNYSFIARDVGHWLFVPSGTNWNPGWYKILSVNAGAATVDAAAGHGVTWNDPANNSPSGLVPTTLTGIATVASPTSGKWSIDYSQTGAAGITFTDMVIDAATNTEFTSAGNPVGKNMIGNAIAVSSGTGFTVQRVTINSVGGVAAFCSASLGTLASTGGNGILGGALASPGQFGALAASNNECFIKTGTYSVTSASSNVAGGCVTMTGGSATAASRLVGYGSVRGDLGSRPTIQASGISTFTLLTMAAFSFIENIKFDGASLTSSRGISGGSIVSMVVQYCKFSNFTNTAINLSGANANSAWVAFCEITGCTTVIAATIQGTCYACTSHDNTVTGFSNGSDKVCTFIDCVSCNNTGGSSSGFTIGGIGGAGNKAINCTAYGNGSDGFHMINAVSCPNVCINCCAENNGGFGFSTVGTTGQANFFLVNCGAFNNTSGAYSAGMSYNYNFVTLTSTAFSNAAGNNFTLNNSPTGGALLRGAAVPGAVAANQFPGLSTLNYLDVGAAQHQDGQPFPADSGTVHETVNIYMN